MSVESSFKAFSKNEGSDNLLKRIDIPVSEINQWKKFKYSKVFEGKAAPVSFEPNKYGITMVLFQEPDDEELETDYDFDVDEITEVEPKSSTTVKIWLCRKSAVVLTALTGQEYACTMFDAVYDTSGYKSVELLKNDIHNIYRNACVNAFLNVGQVHVHNIVAGDEDYRYVDDNGKPLHTISVSDVDYKRNGVSVSPKSSYAYKAMPYEFCPDKMIMNGIDDDYTRMNVDLYNRHMFHDVLYTLGHDMHSDDIRDVLKPDERAGWDALCDFPKTYTLRDCTYLSEFTGDNKDGFFKACHDYLISAGDLVQEVRDDESDEDNTHYELTDKCRELLSVVGKLGDPEHGCNDNCRNIINDMINGHWFNEPSVRENIHTIDYNLDGVLYTDELIGYKNIFTGYDESAGSIFCKNGLQRFDDDMYNVYGNIGFIVGVDDIRFSLNDGSDPFFADIHSFEPSSPFAPKSAHDTLTEDECRKIDLYNRITIMNTLGDDKKFYITSDASVKDFDDTICVKQNDSRSLYNAYRYRENLKFDLDVYKDYNITNLLINKFHTNAENFFKDNAADELFGDDFRRKYNKYLLDTDDMIKQEKDGIYSSEKRDDGTWLQRVDSDHVFRKYTDGVYRLTPDGEDLCKTVFEPYPWDANGKEINEIVTAMTDGHSGVGKNRVRKTVSGKSGKNLDGMSEISFDNTGELPFDEIDFR